MGGYCLMAKPFAVLFTNEFELEHQIFQKITNLHKAIVLQQIMNHMIMPTFCMPKSRNFDLFS